MNTAAGMLEDAVKEVYGIFSRRFLFNALMPTSIFMTLTIGLVVLVNDHAADLTNWWKTTPIFSQILLAFAYAGSVLFVSAIVASQWRGIVRLFEGYPLARIAQRFGRRPIGVAWHRERMKALRNRASPLYRPYIAYYRYPHSRHEDELLPSRLGNILLAGERYSHDRYGADGIVFWPRLYPLLPARFQSDYYAFIINYEFPLVVSLEAAIATMICSGAVLLAHGPVWLFLVIFATGIVLSYTFYVASLSSAEDLAEQQRTAFDLFRAELIAGWPVATDVKDEKLALKEINEFIVFDDKPAWSEPSGLAKRRAGMVNVTLAQPPGQ